MQQSFINRSIKIFCVTLVFFTFCCNVLCLEKKPLSSEEKTLHVQDFRSTMQDKINNKIYESNLEYESIAILILTSEWMQQINDGDQDKILELQLKLSNIESYSNYTTQVEYLTNLSVYILEGHGFSDGVRESIVKQDEMHGYTQAINGIGKNGIPEILEIKPKNMNEHGNKNVFNEHAESVNVIFEHYITLEEARRLETALQESIVKEDEMDWYIEEVNKIGQNDLLKEILEIKPEKINKQGNEHVFYERYEPVNVIFDQHNTTFNAQKATKWLYPNFKYENGDIMKSSYKTVSKDVEDFSKDLGDIKDTEALFRRWSYSKSTYNDLQPFRKAFICEKDLHVDGELEFKQVTGSMMPMSYLMYAQDDPDFYERKIALTFLDYGMAFWNPKDLEYTSERHKQVFDKIKEGIEQGVNFLIIPCSTSIDQGSMHWYALVIEMINTYPKSINLCLIHTGGKLVECPEEILRVYGSLENFLYPQKNISEVHETLKDIVELYGSLENLRNLLKDQKKFKENQDMIDLCVFLKQKHDNDNFIKYTINNCGEIATGMQTGSESCGIALMLILKQFFNGNITTIENSKENLKNIITNLNNVSDGEMQLNNIIFPGKSADAIKCKKFSKKHEFAFIYKLIKYTYRRMEDIEKNIKKNV
jgi:hypothetical protein